MTDILFPRTKLVEKFRTMFTASTEQYIAIIGPNGSGKTTFLTLLESALVWVDSTALHISTLDPTLIPSGGAQTIIIDDINYPSISDIRTFIDTYSPDSRVIFTSQSPIKDEGVVEFVMSGVSYREYAEGMGINIDIASIMSGSVDISNYNTLRDTYLHLGQFPDNLNHPDHITDTFQSKIAIINTELFKKEESDFLEFVRTLAMNVGDIYKEDRIAKMMDISRRKVRKYTELLMKHDMIRAVGPWVKDSNTELTRHVKIYFTDLSYLHVALGVSYYHGENKQGVIENFIFLELDRKLVSTHDIKFYRKKSGAEVSFILVDHSSQKITPIDITTRSTSIIPQALRIFQSIYQSDIEHMMFLNESIALQTSIENTPLIILPHIAI